MRHPCICVIGGTGFVGRHLLNILSGAGYRTRVPTRHPHRYRDLRLVPGCELVQLEQWDEAGLADLMVGCDAVVNLVGILNEGGGRTFEQSHVGMVESTVRGALAAGVGAYLHMSALNADPAGPSDYLRSKGRGEAVASAAAEQGLAVTVFRPSVIFGPGDGLFNRFASLLRLLPGPFPLACADARFAPVYVGDVAAAMLRTLRDPASRGQIYELCGPRTFALRDILTYTGSRIGRKVRVVALSDRLARLQARLFEKLPGKPFSTDNYLSLQIDSICREDGLGRLGIAATDVDAVVPAYLG
ncbi:complex I NDUFA9 subunit family protein [Thiocapsa marina]|uniref:NAD-dependent epimerase/dehydratase n=1 Tax=Thiocapsa marina 5811 TaxID=768671 RepID=F9UB23_9GAMM|nr:complex I NDUFA9 subunit family protein [Thiocapsa marina]EGV18641.1 NAD-dependent epimerase/dehydratase [Thiocapsa marina 5811]